MLIEHKEKKPNVHNTAYIAPNAVISGDVTIEEGVRVLYGAVITSEGAPIIIKKNSIVMEQAVLRSSGGKKSYFPLVIGEQVLIGPHAYLSGCKVENNVFFAAASKAYNGAVIGEGSIIAIGGIVHVNAQLPKESRVPIYNIAFGNPARICSPNEVEEIGKQLQNIDFLSTVFQIP
jgi:carbonic anhydrase/acetyltransferase-like protein (isoleucine patch superfamily)